MSEPPVGADTDDQEETYRSPGRVPLDARGGWYNEFREDLARYSAHHDGNTLKALMLEQPVWALLHYRITSAIYRRSGGKPSPPVMAALVLSQKFVEVITGISLHYKADFAPGLYIGHFGPTYISPDAKIGTGCNLSHGTTIGVSGRGSHRGVPTIGNRVYIGPFAVIAGKITIGDEAVIGANSTVTRDVPAGCTAIGNPAQVVSQKGTPGMGLHQIPQPDPAAAASESQGSEQKLRAL